MRHPHTASRILITLAFSSLAACGSWGIAPPVVTPEIPLVEADGENARVRLEGGELVLELGPVDLPAQPGHAESAPAAGPTEGGDHAHGHAAPAPEGRDSVAGVATGHAHPRHADDAQEASAAGSHGHGVPQPEPLLARVPVDGWLHGYEVELVDAEGRSVPRSVLHHVNLIAPDRRELFSPIMQRVAAAGEETAPVRLPGVVGYPVREGMRLLLTAMYHNPTGQEWRGVRLRVRLPYTRQRARRPMIPVFPFYMDVMPPAGVHAYDLPAGRSEQSWEGRPAVSGRILGLGGHLHRHGVVLRLEDVTSGKVLWEASPEVEEDGSVGGMPQGMFWWRLGIRVRPDRLYRLTAVYDNPGEGVVEGAMGALGGIILPDAGQAWPPVDPRHPVYEKDVATVLGLDDEEPPPTSTAAPG